MIGRLVAVACLFFLIVGVLLAFNSNISQFIQEVLDSTDKQAIIDNIKIIAGGLGILGTVFAFLAAVWKFVEGASQEKSVTSHTATFKKEVYVHSGDFVMGNKNNTEGNKDAG